MRSASLIVGIAIFGLATASPKAPFEKRLSRRAVSTDTRCGASGNGATCAGSSFGNCCSRDGVCGRTSTHCLQSNGCQSQFGGCWGIFPYVQPVSRDSRCGDSFRGTTCTGSGLGDCCSSTGFCGSSSGFCAPSNCQPLFGRCDSQSSSSAISSSRGAGFILASSRSSIVASSSRVTSSAAAPSSSAAAPLSSSVAKSSGKGLAPISKSPSSSKGNTSSAGSSSIVASSSIQRSSRLGLNSIRPRSSASTASSLPASSSAHSSSVVSSPKASLQAVSKRSSSVHRSSSLVLSSIVASSSAYSSSAKAASLRPVSAKSQSASVGPSSSSFFPSSSQASSSIGQLMSVSRAASSSFITVSSSALVPSSSLVASSSVIISSSAAISSSIESSVAASSSLADSSSIAASSSVAQSSSIAEWSSIAASSSIAESSSVIESSSIIASSSIVESSSVAATSSSVAASSSAPPSSSSVLVSSSASPSPSASARPDPQCDRDDGQCVGGERIVCGYGLIGFASYDTSTTAADCLIACRDSTTTCTGFIFVSGTCNLYFSTGLQRDTMMLTGVISGIKDDTCSGASASASSSAASPSASPSAAAAPRLRNPTFVQPLGSDNWVVSSSDSVYTVQQGTSQGQDDSFSASFTSIAPQVNLFTPPGTSSIAQSFSTAGLDSGIYLIRFWARNLGRAGSASNFYTSLDGQNNYYYIEYNQPWTQLPAGPFVVDSSNPRTVQFKMTAQFRDAGLAAIFQNILIDNVQFYKV